MRPHHVLQRVEPWQKAFPNLWDGSDATAEILKNKYDRYCTELKSSSFSPKKSGAIHRQHLIIALSYAVQKRKEEEINAEYAEESGLLKEWREAVEILKSKGKLEISQ